LRKRIPGLVLRTSLIAGLPGEGEKEFEELREFLCETKIELAGVFVYSPEEGTKASKMERPSKEVAEHRAELLCSLQADVIAEWNKSRIGTVTTVLVENDKTIGRSYAESPDIDGYIRIKTKGIEANTFIDVKITGVENGELVGERYELCK